MVGLAYSDGHRTGYAEALARFQLTVRDPFWQVPGLEQNERAVLAALARGGPVAMLAARLEVNPRTVYRIARRGLRKLNQRLPGNKQYDLEDLTALAFELLEKAAGLEAD